MPKIGYHTSSSGGYVKAVERANDYNLEVFQLFLGSPRTWSYRDLKKDEPEKFQQACNEFGYDTKIVHLNYLPNPSTPMDDEEMREKTDKAFRTEVERCDLLGIDYLVFHIGSHKGKGFDVARPMVAQTVNSINDEMNPEVTLLLETSAGQANSVGSKFEEIGEILDEIDELSNVGVCFDTCHVFAAGYDIRTVEDIDETFQEFDQYIGLDKLKVVHANDSKGELGEGKDRHAHIGDGYIGKEGFKSLLARPELKELPIILETPSSGVKNDINLLKELRP